MIMNEIAQVFACHNYYYGNYNMFKYFQYRPFIGLPGNEITKDGKKGQTPYY